MNNGKIHVKGIMFDLDGTILDTKPAYVEAARIAFLATGQKQPSEADALAIPKRIEQRQQIVDLVHVDPKRFLSHYLKAFYEISAAKTLPFPNVEKTLETLATRAKLAVITMRHVPCDAVEMELGQFHLSKYFSHIVTALDTSTPKPSPEALIRAVTAMDVDMCTCLIVGDSVVDVEAGKAAGSKTVSVLTGLYTRKELLRAKPDYILDDVNRLPRLLA